MYIAPKNTKPIISEKKTQKKDSTMGKWWQKMVAIVFKAVVVLKIL
jgi:hypothetical protein